jgi:hypothetical protein
MSDGRAWVAPGSGMPPDAHGGTRRRPYEPYEPAHPGGLSPDDLGLGADRGELLGGDIPLRPLGVAEILDGAIVNIRYNPKGVLGLALAITTVVQVLQSLATYLLIGDAVGGEGAPIPVSESVGTQLVVGTLGLLMSAYVVLLLAGILGPAMGRTLFGLPTSPGQVWRDSRPRLLHLIGVATVVMLLSVAAAALPAVPFVLAVAAGGPAEAGVLAGVVGFPLGFMLMVWLYVLFALAAPAVVIERQGVFAALGRARRLVRGTWWRMCGILLLTLLITVFMGFFALRIPFVVAELVLFGSDLSEAEVLLQLALDTAGRIVSWTLTIPFDAGVIALLYMDRRMRREGFDLELQTRDDAAPQPADFLDLWRPAPTAPAPTAPDPIAPTGPDR